MATDWTWEGPWETLNTFMRRAATTEEKARKRLVAWFDGPPASEALKVDRFPLIKDRAEEVFLFHRRIRMRANVSPATRDYGEDGDPMLAALSTLEVANENLATPLARRVCYTCGKKKTERKFYNFGSRSCRACNVKGATR